MIYEDGIYDLSNEEYHASSAISRSQLKLMDKSPYHFWYHVLSGENIPARSSESLNIGSAFHTLLLEPHLFEKEFAIAPKVDRRTKAGKEAFAEFSASAEGKIILSAEQFSTVSTMVRHVASHEIVTTLISDAQYEKSIFWTDEATGLQFRVRPDIWSEKIVVDLKTTKETNIHKFKWGALDYGYYLQAGMIYEACQSLGRPFEAFAILACEKDVPHVPVVYTLDGDALQYGIDKFQHYKKRLKKCIDTNTWEGYGIHALTVPAGAIAELENAISSEGGI